jgi:phosphatidylserine/phosphatidylglycerophosphate/cardiolipin synthase-like enzyme
MANDIQVKTWVAKALADQPGITSQANEIAALFADFVGQAKSTLDIAIYDFRLDPPQGKTVMDALNAAAGRGVAVRVAYFDQPAATAAGIHQDGGDPTPGMTAADLAALHKDIQRKAIAGIAIQDLPADVKKQPIEGGGHLMHSKYMVRDGQTVWMGSSNFTTAAWSVQDNNVVQVHAPALAACYSTDFDELWKNGRIAGTGKNDLGKDVVDGIAVECAFSPGDGSTIEKEIAGVIMGAQSTVHIASMVISSGAILGALVDAIGRKVAVTGVYDGPEMKVVMGDWAKGAKSGKSSGKPQQWARLAQVLVAKASAPYTPAGPHNFMHDKLVAVDGKLVVTGSFNFSENATHNAENVLTIHDAGIAAEFEAYVDTLVSTYRPGKGGAGARAVGAPVRPGKAARAPAHKAAKKLVKAPPRRPAGKAPVKSAKKAARKPAATIARKRAKQVSPKRTRPARQK